MGHGLVREDMHSGSISHLGIVVLPTLLALSEFRHVRGRNFIAAAVVGYEVGGQIGRAVMDAEVARIHRPTGVTGPVAAAAAGARLLGLEYRRGNHRDRAWRQYYGRFQPVGAHRRKRDVLPCRLRRP